MVDDSKSQSVEMRDVTNKYFTVQNEHCFSLRSQEIGS